MRPDRFHGRGDDPYGCIPQGGGEHAAGHRCPGEWITMEQIKGGAALLAKEMAYSVPPQDLSIDLRRIPRCRRAGS